jgi:hypothetical protein
MNNFNTDIGMDNNSNDDMIYEDNTSDSNPIDINDNNNGNINFYIDEDGNIVHVNENGEKLIYHICNTCSNAVYMTDQDYICKYCGSDMREYTIYQVKKGDTLSKISGKVGVSVDAIVEFNGIENIHLIYEGESLRIPK